MNLELDKIYEVTVVKIIKVGAIVQTQDGETQLIHISNISNCFVPDVRQFVSVRDIFDAKCIQGVDGRLQLSLKHLKLHPASTKSESIVKDIKAVDNKKSAVRKVKSEGQVIEHGTKDLEKMIEDSNRAFNDKFGKSAQFIPRSTRSSKRPKTRKLY